MKLFSNRINKTINITASLLAGILLFAILISFSINMGVLNSRHHKYLFNKYDIYSHTREAISYSVSTLMRSSKKDAAGNDINQNLSISAMLNTSLTPEMIQINLDSLREGIFQYLKGERRFLPDIYLNAGSANSSANEDNSSNSAAQPLLKIDKINLSAILLYFNRSDIAEQLLVLKLFYYIMSKLPKIFLLVLLLLLTGFGAGRNLNALIKCIKSALLTGGILSTAAGLFLFSAAYLVVPEKVIQAASELPFPGTVVVSYVRSCFYYSALLIMAGGLLLLLFSALLHFLPGILPTAFSCSGAIPDNQIRKRHFIIKYSVFGFVFIFLVAALAYKFYTIDRDFKANEYYSIISKIRNSTKVTQVIAASSDTIYTLQVKLVDKKDKKPVKDVSMNVNGKSDFSEKFYNNNITTNDEGMAKLLLDNGKFLLSFIPIHFPENYKMPDPFSFDLKLAGTTLITIELDTIPETLTQRWGIAEIEVLDKDNKPVPNLELAVGSTVFAPGYPDKLLSYTNSEGIAVFKMDEGIYKIGFTESKFPKQYVLPDPMDITVSAGSVTRYTIRTADMKHENTTLKSSPNSGQNSKN